MRTGNLFYIGCFAAALRKQVHSVLKSHTAHVDFLGMLDHRFHDFLLDLSAVFSGEQFPEIRLRVMTEEDVVGFRKKPGGRLQFSWLP